MSVPYVNIISYKWPDRECYSVGPTYAQIIWTDGQAAIPEQDILNVHLEYAKEEAIEYIKDLSSKEREAAELKVLGTDDPNFIKVYEEKYSASKHYIEETAAGRTPDPILTGILTAEAAGFSVTEDWLAAEIVSQHEAAFNQLMPIIGDIEAIRRTRIFQIEAAPDVATVEQLRTAAIIWPDLSGLTVI